MKRVLFVAFIFLWGINTKADNLLQQILPWDNIKSFSISTQEDYVVFSATDDKGREILYEASKHNNTWSNPSPIQSINSSYAAKGNMGGVFLAYEEDKLYFHADFAGGKGGKDLYYAERSKGQWSLPHKMPFNSEYDDMYLSMVPGGTKCAFVRKVLVDDKKQLFKGIIFIAEQLPDGTWDTPQQASSYINLHGQTSPCWATDAKTLYFAQTEDNEEMEDFALMYTHNFYGDGWVIPLNMHPDEKTNYVCPRVINNRLYFIQQTTHKKAYKGVVCAMELPENFAPKAVAKKTIQVVSTDKKPLETDVLVFNPTTLKRLGKYTTDKHTGITNFFLRMQDDYLIEIRKKGYSYAAIHTHAQDQHANKIPTELVLFDTVNLVLNVFDGKIFLPLKNLTIQVKETETNLHYQPQMLEPGVFVFALPVGKKYMVDVTAPYFKEEHLLFETFGDLTFQHVEREILMKPLQRKMNIQVLNAETNELISAIGRCENKNREEIIEFETTDTTEATINLRYADTYTIAIEANEEYVFFTENVEVNEDMEENKSIALQPLKTGQKVRLNNILFETNSTSLDAISFEELERVVKLLKKYPQLSIELHAHTDNVGTKAYNKKLSDRRAKAVLNYLVENGIEKERLQSIGWGMEHPLTSNDTEEGRMLNRRVEFVIL